MKNKDRLYNKMLEIFNKKRDYNNKQSKKREDKK